MLSFQRFILFFFFFEMNPNLLKEKSIYEVIIWYHHQHHQCSFGIHSILLIEKQTNQIWGDSMRFIWIEAAFPSNFIVNSGDDGFYFIFILHHLVFECFVFRKIIAMMKCFASRLVVFSYYWSFCSLPVKRDQ